MKLGINLTNNISQIRNVLNKYPILCDVIFFFITLVSCFLLFYSKWQICSNHSTYLHAAWETLNGAKLYVDLIDFHLPGIILVNILCWFIGNSELIAIRMLDILSVFILCISAAWIMMKWQISFPIRVFSLTLFLISYLFNGPCETAEIETFALAFTMLGLIPWLSQQKEMKKYCWVASGIFIGLSLWTSFFHVLFFVFTLYYLFPKDKSEQKIYLQNLSACIIGVIITSAGFISWLYSTGSLNGFIQWGIKFYFNEYLQAQLPLKTMLEALIQKLWYLDEKWPLIYVGFVLFISYIFDKQRFKTKETELNILLGLLAVSLVAIILQGKILQHQLIPLQFFLVFLGALITSGIAIPKIYQDLKPITIIICLIFLVYTGLGYTKRINTNDKLEKLVTELKKYMEEDETFVTFGATPYLYYKLHRTIKYPFINSLTMYETSNLNTKKEIIDELINVLQNKKVKFFIVQNQDTAPFNGQSQNTRAIVGQYIGLGKLRELGFIRNTTVFELDIFERIH
ncbi:MAG: hypothetical protein HYZ79_03110 [Candidatus Melainabacteria bacterium]|nr:hypothetical protein [Candidatus Melainabacteria bacterium]